MKKIIGLFLNNLIIKLFYYLSKHIYIKKSAVYTTIENFFEKYDKNKDEIVSLGELLYKIYRKDNND